MQMPGLLLPTGDSSYMVKICCVPVSEQVVLISLSRSKKVVRPSKNRRAGFTITCYHTGFSRKQP